MSWDGIVIAAATILAAVLGVLLMWHLKRRRNETKWKHLSYGNIPMWVIHRVYKHGFPDRVMPITRDHYILKGAYYEYLVRVKDLSITEPIAQVRHFKVFRRKKK